MKINKVTKNHKHYPSYFKEITYPPKELYFIGEPLLDYLPAVTIVGSRKLSSYGQATTYQIAQELAKQGITIISGLALGADGVAHRGALEAGGQTIAILSCGLDAIYPASHRNLALELLRQGGTILSEYPEGTPALKQNFIARNRLVAALGDMTIVTEAAEASGSLITASFALEQNKQIGAVPGNITSPLSSGTNNLIKAGAIPITTSQDILDALGLEAATKQRAEVFGDTEQEQRILDLLKAGLDDLETLQLQSKLSPSDFNQTLTMLELSGKIRSSGAAHWALK